MRITTKSGVESIEMTTEQETELIKFFRSTECVEETKYEFKSLEMSQLLIGGLVFNVISRGMFKPLLEDFKETLPRDSDTRRVVEIVISVL